MVTSRPDFPKRASWSLRRLRPGVALEQRGSSDGVPVLADSLPKRNMTACSLISHRRYTAIGERRQRVKLPAAVPRRTGTDPYRPRELR